MDKLNYWPCKKMLHRSFTIYLLLMVAFMATSAHAVTFADPVTTEDVSDSFETQRDYVWKPYYYDLSWNLHESNRATYVEGGSLHLRVSESSGVRTAQLNFAGTISGDFNIEANISSVSFDSRTQAQSCLFLGHGVQTGSKAIAGIGYNGAPYLYGQQYSAGTHTTFINQFSSGITKLRLERVGGTTVMYGTSNGTEYTLGTTQAIGTEDVIPIVLCNSWDASILPASSAVISSIKLLTGNPELDPLIVDNDGDGISEDDGDCDDTNALSFPGNPEIANDGIDQDCDGSDLVEAVDPPANIPGPEEWGGSGKVSGQAYIKVETL